jgi:hypothetical protein
MKQAIAILNDVSAVAIYYSHTQHVGREHNRNSVAILMWLQVPKLSHLDVSKNELGPAEAEALSKGIANWFVSYHFTTYAPIIAITIAITVG